MKVRNALLKKGAQAPFFWFMIAFLFLSCLFLPVLSAAGEGASPQQCSNEDSQDGACSSETMTNELNEVIFAPLGEPDDFTSSTLGVKLAVRRYIPINVPKAVVVFQHGGAGWHSGYTKILGEYMQSNDIAFIAYDQMGSGHSDGFPHNHKTLRQYLDSMDTVANDFTKILEDTRKEFPRQKVFAMGESFGCMVLLHQVMLEQDASGNTNNQRLADGYVFTGPVVKVLAEMLPPAFALKILKFLAKFFPMLTMPGTDFFSTFDLAFGDQRWAKAGRADPFIQEAAAVPPRLGMVASILSTMENVYDHLDTINVPFQIFLGENEARVDTDAVKKLAKVAKSKDKGITIVPRAYHQLFQDQPDVTQSVCDGVKGWILDRV
jgi:alpha-beta hydrolase superfamily lysophospholipase